MKIRGSFRAADFHMSFDITIAIPDATISPPVIRFETPGFRRFASGAAPTAPARVATAATASSFRSGSPRIAK